ncbi:hypothetical protein OSB04_023346 [Centaurea solstitialis]|uniref:RING-type E3 ubiquitin transferase n=1 Tax=Centaurea solstitialis TaxID=347529 RepID=A0AA38SKN1_9ASTR|nr:hypothetical protein OSB04_023346 [Centaurea solstitialis]
MAITKLMEEVIGKVKEISEISGYFSFLKKPFVSLAGRLTVMLPFFREMRDFGQDAPRELSEALTSLLKHLEDTRRLLQLGSKGSKIYLVLKREEIREEYEEVVAALEKDLRRVCGGRLDNVSFEVKEYAIIVLRQFERARNGGNIFDAPADHDTMYEELLQFLYKNINDDDWVLDLGSLKGLIDALGLRKAIALQQEYAALNEIAAVTRGSNLENIEKMFMVLDYIKEYLHTEKGSHVDSSPGESYIGAREGIADITNYDNKVIPNEFLCPISLQLMEDPVIISSGQTYERESIQRWLDAGNGTCPKTRQFLTEATLTPNHALRCLIVQWREINRIDAPKAVSTTSYSISAAERKSIMSWIVQLEIGQEHFHLQRHGSGELYQLAKRSAEIREAIGEAGAIPYYSEKH